MTAESEGEKDAAQELSELEWNLEQQLELKGDSWRLTFDPLISDIFGFENDCLGNKEEKKQKGREVASKNLSSQWLMKKSQLPVRKSMGMLKKVPTTTVDIFFSTIW